MVIFTILVDLADVIGTMNPFSFPMWYHYLTSYLFYLFLNLLPALYAFYILTLIDRHSQLLRFKSMIAFFFPLLILGVILLSNPVFGWLFTYDENRNYSRGPALYLLHVIAFYYQFYGLFCLTKYRNSVRPSKRAALSSFVPLVAVPSLIQLFCPQLLIVLLGAALCMLMTFLTIQNPDELLSARTGLFNYTALMQQVTAALGSGKEFYVISACITRYDYLARTLGDTLMTEILREIAHALQQLPIRQKELYFLRDGQFVMLLPIGAMYPQLPAQLQDVMEGGSRSNRMEVSLTADISVVRCPQDAHTPDFLSTYLEFLSEHRDSTLPITPEYAKNTHARVMAVEQAVKNALANGRFEVYYQPIFSVKDDRINSAEALLRLKDPELGFVPPDEFIPITERNGMIIEIGMFVFQSVCKFISENNLKRLGIDYVEINLSVEQCMQKKLASQLINTIETYHLPSDCINLEITETAISYSTETLEYNMNTLAATGVRFSLDDYGTGYSNMSSMVRLPFHLVKIDKGIVSAMGDERTFIAISSTIAMFKQMHIGIVAEGVETLEQVELLSTLGCDYLQGYYFSKPLPADIFLAECTSQIHVPCCSAG